tara:strand:- start:1073 stop:1372 length:300 start_codon:yes stop_codon:yes gene_type:complete
MGTQLSTGQLGLEEVRDALQFRVYTARGLGTRQSQIALGDDDVKDIRYFGVTSAWPTFTRLSGHPNSWWRNNYYMSIFHLRGLVVADADRSNYRTVSSS